MVVASYVFYAWWDWRFVFLLAGSTIANQAFALAIHRTGHPERRRAILALAAWFAVTVNINVGVPIVGALLFPVGFCMLYLFGFDLLTGVFVLCPLALIDRRPGVTLQGVLRTGVSSS